MVWPLRVPRTINIKTFIFMNTSEKLRFCLYALYDTLVKGIFADIFEKRRKDKSKFPKSINEL